MTSTLIAILSIAIGLLIGFFIRDIRDRVKALEENMKKEKPDVGATLGVYAPVNEFARTNQPTQVGIVETKTPQRVEFEAEESLRKEVRGQ